MLNSVTSGKTYYTKLVRLNKIQSVEVINIHGPIVEIKITNGLNTGQIAKISLSTFKDTYFENKNDIK